MSWIAVWSDLQSGFVGKILQQQFYEVSLSEPSKYSTVYDTRTLKRSLKAILVSLVGGVNMRKWHFSVGTSGD